MSPSEGSGSLANPGYGPSKESFHVDIRPISNAQVGALGSPSVQAMSERSEPGDRSTSEKKRPLADTPPNTEQVDALRRAADSLVTNERRLERSPSLGPRAERTRRKLVDSAELLFKEKGYTRTTVAEIAKCADVSLPTFYQYFSELNEIVSVIIVDFIKQSLERGLDRWDVVGTGRAGLKHLVEEFTRTYVEYVDLMELWESAKLTSPAVRALSRDYASVYNNRFEVSLSEGIAAGLVRDDLAAADMADIVTTTLEYYCYDHFVLSRQSLDDVPTAVTSLTEMIADSVRLLPSA